MSTTGITLKEVMLQGERKGNISNNPHFKFETN